MRTLCLFTIVHCTCEQFYCLNSCAIFRSFTLDMAKNQQLVLSAETIQAIIQGLANNKILASTIAPRVRTDTSTQRGTPKKQPLTATNSHPEQAGDLRTSHHPCRPLPQEIPDCLLLVMTLLIPQPYVRIRQHSSITW